MDFDINTYKYEEEMVKGQPKRNWVKECGRCLGVSEVCVPVHVLFSFLLRFLHDFSRINIYLYRIHLSRCWISPSF